MYQDKTIQMTWANLTVLVTKVSFGSLKALKGSNQVLVCFG
jgi:hypothetical protein